ncbi:MAG: hypothetical protein JOY84_03945 [Curvibacter sp.]|nr:hypothetical protein [Curvibacter sp.]
MSRRLLAYLLLAFGLLFAQQGVLRHGYSHDLGGLRLAAKEVARAASTSPSEDPSASALCELCLAYAQLAVTLPSHWAFDSQGHEAPRERPRPELAPPAPHAIRASIRGPPLIL